jgi:CRISPR/Cas system Type II protein with McrA/HNH and RuvC-like nuclease domain
MLSRQTRIAVLTAQASRKYGPAILETAALLEELIRLVKSLDRLPKRTAWPKKVLMYLAERQNGICPECNRRLPCLEEEVPHVDHVVPFAQGGENSVANIRLLHAQCNLSKSDECSIDDVIAYLGSRLLNLRSPATSRP